MQCAEAPVAAVVYRFLGMLEEPFPKRNHDSATGHQTRRRFSRGCASNFGSRLIHALATRFFRGLPLRHRSLQLGMSTIALPMGSAVSVTHLGDEKRISPRGD